MWDAPDVSSPDELAAFAGQVSHDLKNPLAGVSMSIELAREEAGSLAAASPVLISLLDRAGRGAHRMRGMIDALHAYAIAGSGTSPEPVDLAAVVEELDPSLESHDLPTVTADPDQMRTLLANLLDNAAQFTREGDPSQVSVSASRAGDSWRVEVADNGRGIPAEERDRVFEPMVRLDKTVPGTGVGLATCRRIVEAHGGRIGLAEAPGGGTVAWFELPA
jgi:signal transduction histidine kinase